MPQLGAVTRLLAAEALPLPRLDTFPLRVSSNGRYLEDASGAPFRIKCDAGWMSGTHLSVAQQNTYMDGIKALGFNAFILMNIVHSGGGFWVEVNEPADADGVQPFTTPGNFSTPNSAYFTKVSDLIDRALSRGLAVMFFHGYLGYLGQEDGWEDEIVASTNSVMFDWGVYLATTFTQPNICWMHGGDNNLSGTALTRYQQLVAGIQSVSRNRLCGSEWFGPDSHVTDQSGFTYGTNPATTDMQLDWYYGAGPDANGLAYITADEAWRASTTLPSFAGEPMYYQFEMQEFISRSDVRRVQHWIFMAGSIAGSNFGHTDRWDFLMAGNAWSATFSEVATLDQGYRNTFYDSLEWWNYRPSGTASNSPHGGSGYSDYCGRVLIVSGQGTTTSLITSCLSRDGTSLLAYVPPTGTGTRNFSVDLRSMAGNSRARWWNPTSGAYTDITGGSYSLANSLSSQAFTTPGNNGTGTNDWVLVCDTL